MFKIGIESSQKPYPPSKLELCKIKPGLLQVNHQVRVDVHEVWESSFRELLIRRQDKCSILIHLRESSSQACIDCLSLVGNDSFGFQHQLLSSKLNQGSRCINQQKALVRSSRMDVEVGILRYR